MVLQRNHCGNSLWLPLFLRVCSYKINSNSEFETVSLFLLIHYKNAFTDSFIYESDSIVDSSY